MSEYPVAVPGTKSPVLMWALEHEVEPQAMQQIRNVAELPGMYGIRVMPDVHLGDQATIGTVIAMEQALAPSAVGVDIGCGVNAVKTNLFLEDLDARDLQTLRARFENVIPVGFNKHEREVNSVQLGVGSTKQFWDRFGDLSIRDQLDKKESDAYCQLGTLGNGNHFIELCTDSENRIWVTLHSGSRGIGNLIARIHIEIAKGLPQNQDLPGHLKGLSMFYKGTPEMEAYRNDLYWAQDYAMISRKIMMALVKRELSDYMRDRPGQKFVKYEDDINCHHNYVAEEIIDGKEMIVTRKGAIFAGKDALALIPGSMATGSYIVRGRGNPASFQSASHGAGRKMSRSAAKKEFTVEDVERTMRGIEARKDASVIDEISLAYKDLDSVIEAQTDLVDVVEKLDTILCVKG